MRLFRENHRAFFLSLSVFVLMACGDGGCSSCASCGVAPIPGGYPIADRIDNSMQVRLTDDGIGFIEDNIGAIVAGFLPGGLDFPVPRSDFGSGLTSGTICPASNCVAHMEIQDMELTPVAPDTLHAHLFIVLDSRNLAGMRAAWPIDLAIGGSNLDLDSRRGARTFIGFEADIRFLEETEAARNGYTWISVENAQLVDGEGIEDADLDFSGGFLSWLLNAVKGILIDMIVDQITGILDSTLAEQLCTTQGEYGCPTGTVAAGPDPTDVCQYTAGGRCVPTLLGTDGQGDLGQAFLGGVSPGTHAPGQFLLASGGEGEAVNGGMSLFFYGGYRSTDLSFTTSPAHNPCVPVIAEPPLPAIPRAAAFRSNTIPGTGASAHVGIGLSEMYLNHAGYGMFDSGLLCIGAGTRLSQQLSSGLLSALIGSLRGLTFPEPNAAVAISVRPQRPPTFEIGAGTADEALLTISLGEPDDEFPLPGVDIDFYIWSTERYVRFMTYSADLAIPLNLRVEDGAIVPEITAVNTTGSVVTNSELLTEDPEFLASIVETVISEFASSLTGGLSPITLPDLMGLDLVIPDGGIVGVDDSGEEFLGIFANLAIASTAAPYTALVDTDAVLEQIEIDPVSFAPETYGQGERPWVRVVADGAGPMGVDYEYSWRVNGKQWSAWTEERVLEIHDSAFMLQARHDLEVRARITGEAGSTDPSPAYFEVLVDVLAPFVSVEQSGRGVYIVATDVLTAPEALELRYRIDGEAWTDWQALPTDAFVPLPYTDAELEVEVRDESGNVGAARSALIRGLPNSTVDSGCGCSTFESEATPWSSLVALFAFALFFFRRRSQKGGRATSVDRSLDSDRRSLRPGSVEGGAGKLLGLLVVVLSLVGLVGCDCNSDPGGPDAPSGPCGGACVDAIPPATAGSACCEMTNMCVLYDLAELCDPGYICSGGDAVTLDEGCGASCSDCVVQPALNPGVLATHLDMVVGADGSMMLSGYSPGDAPARRYGDLVVGSLASATAEPTWEILDGAPSEPITNDPGGYRGGVSMPGPDVGRWTSMAESGGQYFVSYWDRDAGALKLAVGTPGAWTVTVVDDTGDSGRYSSLAIDAAGNPAIAYLQITAADDGTGVVTSRAKVAVADSPAPTGPTDWLSTEIATATMLCRPEFCPEGQSCTEAGLCVTASGDCGGTCASDEVCSSGACEAALADDYVEDMPPALGMYNSLVSTGTGLALVYYDRTAGNLYGASNDGTSWAAPFLIDGYGTDTLGVGDSGQAASLFVDAAGIWHVSYVDGAEETLRYARVDAGTTTAEVVDNGATDGTTPNPDGRHIVGDDSSIVVTDGGEIRIVYQDATSQRAMMARRPASGGAWAISSFDAMDSTGYWLEQALFGNTSVVVTYYRAGDTGAVRVFNID